MKRASRATALAVVGIVALAGAARADTKDEISVATKISVEQDRAQMLAVLSKRDGLGQAEQVLILQSTQTITVEETRTVVLVALAGNPCIAPNVRATLAGCAQKCCAKCMAAICDALACSHGPGEDILDKRKVEFSYGRITATIWSSQPDTFTWIAVSGYSATVMQMTNCTGVSWDGRLDDCDLGALADALRTCQPETLPHSLDGAPGRIYPWPKRPYMGSAPGPASVRFPVGTVFLELKTDRSNPFASIYDQYGDVAPRVSALLTVLRKIEARVTRRELKGTVDISEGDARIVMPDQGGNHVHVVNEPFKTLLMRQATGPVDAFGTASVNVEMNMIQATLEWLAARTARDVLVSAGCVLPKGSVVRIRGTSKDILGGDWFQVETEDGKPLVIQAADVTLGGGAPTPGLMSGMTPH
jgi:hypothetical protein